MDINGKKGMDMNNKTYRMCCFKAYDIRGKIGTQINEDVVYRIGRAVGRFAAAKHTSKKLLLATISSNLSCIRAALCSGDY